MSIPHPSVGRGTTTTVVSTTPATTATLLPLDASGNAPRAVRLSTVGAAVNVRFGVAGQGCTPTVDDIVIPPNTVDYQNTRGKTTFQAILVSTAAAATAALNICPVEQ